MTGAKTRAPPRQNRSDFAAVATPEDVASFLRTMAIITQTVSAISTLPCHITPDYASAIDTRI